MSRDSRALSGFAVVLTIVLSMFGAVEVRGQGGTGRETPKKNTPPAVPKTTPTKKAPPAFLPKNPRIELVSIPPGSFMRGSTNGDTNEKPVHQVTISYSFYMGKYEVTQAQWQAVMGNNPASSKDCRDNCPVESVSWDDAQKFIQRLNQLNDGYLYRLPTEAEWEYACRAGTTGDYAGNPSEMAWYSENSGRKTHAVGGKQPNAWGLADMLGNVSEWCQDWYHETYYGAPTDGGAWLSGGEQKYRVARGTSWLDTNAANLRSASRGTASPDYRGGHIGFRVVAVVPPAVRDDSTPTQPAPPVRSLAAGQKAKITGKVVWKDSDTFIVQDANSVDTGIRLTNETIITKAGSKQASKASIVSGITLEVEGRGDSTGYLVAEKIKIPNQ